MSGVVLAEKRVAGFVLWPLALAFGGAGWVSFNHGLWLAVGIFFLLMAYMGWLTSNLESARGKLFFFGWLLPSGIELQPRPDEESEELESERERALVRTIAHAYNALMIAVVVAAVATGLRFYWVILIALAMVWLTPLMRSLVIHFVY